MGFALAIAIGVLAAAGKVPRAAVDGVMFFGELGLDGRLRPVRGVLPAVAAAVEAGFGKVMVAELNAAEAVLVPGVRVIAATAWRRQRTGFAACRAVMAARPQPSWKAARSCQAAVRSRPGQRRRHSSGPSPNGEFRRLAPKDRDCA